MEADIDTNCIRRIIQLDPIEQSHQLLAETYRIELVSWNDLLCRGRTIPVFKGIPPRLEDLYCIMWTSGDPKGVMLTQSNIVAALFNLRQLGTWKIIRTKCVIQSLLGLIAFL
jgi:long-subunit acyl-CoA synthetase (AMP-forming)